MIRRWAPEPPRACALPSPTTRSPDCTQAAARHVGRAPAWHPGCAQPRGCTGRPPVQAQGPASLRRHQARPVCRRQTNRESAARTRQFQAQSKQQLREEVGQLLVSKEQTARELAAAHERIAAVTADLHQQPPPGQVQGMGLQQLREEVDQLTASNARASGQLAAAQQRITAVSADLQHMRGLYESALQDRSRLLQCLRSPGPLEARPPPETCTHAGRHACCSCPACRPLISTACLCSLGCGAAATRHCAAAVGLSRLHPACWHRPDACSLLRLSLSARACIITGAACAGRAWLCRAGLPQPWHRATQAEGLHSRSALPSWPDWLPRPTSALLWACTCAARRAPSAMP